MNAVVTQIGDLAEAGEKMVERLRRKAFLPLPPLTETLSRPRYSVRIVRLSEVDDTSAACLTHYG